MSRGYRFESEPRRIRARHLVPFVAFGVVITLAGLMVASDAGDGVMLAFVGVVFVLSLAALQSCKLWRVE